jgi:hypothetical protein
MNPFGENRTVHSTWPVILAIYNIPTWLCHKRQYLMLSILIQRAKEASIDIVVFLEPLIKDMAKLWNEGVHMWDQYQQEYFTLKAIIFVCIHDAPKGFTVSWQTKGKSGCPVCMDGTVLVYLPSSRKLVFMRHRWFLERKPKYRKMKKYFDNTVEKDSTPKWYTGKLLFEIVKNIQVVFEKDLETCHIIDLMHVTKNVLDNIIRILLDMPRKMKDGLKSCNDIVQFGLRPELHPISRPNGKHYLPPTSYSLTIEEKKHYVSACVGCEYPQVSCPTSPN